MRAPAALGIAILLSFLTGCAATTMTTKPQIINPVADGFTPNEYVVIEVKPKGRIGQLYQAKVSKNSPVPKWEEVALMLFPQSADFNKIDEQPFEQTRNLIETTETSSKLTATAIVEMTNQNKAGYKYQAKTSKIYQLNYQTLKYNPQVKNYIAKKLAEDPNYVFAYLDTLYEGTAFVESLYSVSNDAKGAVPAAYEINGKYFTSDTKGVVTSGPIIYRLSNINADVLEASNPTPNISVVSMTAEGKKILALVPPSAVNTIPVNTASLNNIATTNVAVAPASAGANMTTTAANNVAVAANTTVDPASTSAGVSNNQVPSNNVVAVVTPVDPNTVQPLSDADIQALSKSQDVGSMIIPK